MRVYSILKPEPIDVPYYMYGRGARRHVNLPEEVTIIYRDDENAPNTYETYLVIPDFHKALAIIGALNHYELTFAKE